MGPAILFVVLIAGVIVVGLLRPDPVAVIGADRGPIEPIEALGIVLLLEHLPRDAPRLRNPRGPVLTAALRARTDAVIATLAVGLA